MRALAWQGSIGQGRDNAAYEVQPRATRRINEATGVHACTVYLAFAARRAPLHALGREAYRFLHERSLLAHTSPALAP